MTPEQNCPACNQTTESTTCDACGFDSLAPTLDAEDLTATLPHDEVVYLDEQSIAATNKGKRTFNRMVYFLVLFGIPVMCLLFVIFNRDRIVFVIGTIFGLQLVYIYVRAKRFEGPVLNDPDVRSRVGPPLLELCAKAHVTVPPVRIKRSAVQAAVLLQNKVPTLWLSTDFIEVASDAELRAVIAHEVIHLQNNDLARMRSRAHAIRIVAIIAIFTIFVSNHITNWTIVALVYAFMAPTMRLIGAVQGVFNWTLESVADLDGALLANDTAAMIDGLTVVYGLYRNVKRQIYGPSWLWWFLVPYTIPDSGHLSLKQRIAQLSELPLPTPVTETSTATDRGHEPQSVDATVQVRPPTQRTGTGLMQVVVVAVVVMASVVFLAHPKSSSGLSPNVESPGGAHFIPLRELGLYGSIVNFQPFTRSQEHERFIGLHEATRRAEVAEGIQLEYGVHATIAEGNVEDPSLATGLTASPSTRPHWKTAYVVLFFGAEFVGEGFSGSYEVVIVSATRGRILKAFVLDYPPPTYGTVDIVP